jgi:glycosyltransferase involved in cell wall biosynthesis
MPSPPGVSVVMAAYNSAHTVQAAIDSILSQSYADFEFIIIDDGSTDETPDILRTNTDPRIILLPNEQNIGLTRSLNRGLDASRGEYIARMDADDISLPHRLERQIQYMTEHPEIGVLGTNMLFVDEEGQVLHDGRPLYQDFLTPGYIKWLLLWLNPIPHPTVMIHRVVLQETGFKYDPAFKTSQDYALWCRLARFTSLAVLPDVCLHYRLLPTSVTRKQSTQQPRDYYATIKSVMQEQFDRVLGQSVSDRQIEELVDLLMDHQNVEASFDFVGAAGIVARAYRRFMKTPLSGDERQQIRAHVINLVQMIRRQAARFSIPKSIGVRWHLWRILNLYSKAEAPVSDAH